MQETPLRLPDIREYRLVGIKRRTRWRKVPDDGIIRPSVAKAKRLLGEKISLELRGAVLKRGKSA